MNLIRPFVLPALVLSGAALLCAFDDLGPDQLALLQDSGGWEYLSLDDSQNGFPTQHTCFDGQPHPDACSGTLKLTTHKTFVQEVSIEHKSVYRNGTYELNGDQLAFFDEFGNRDGPYTVRIDTENKLMTMDMPQVTVKLQLYKEYKKQLEENRKKQQ